MTTSRTRRESLSRILQQQKDDPVKDKVRDPRKNSPIRSMMTPSGTRCATLSELSNDKNNTTAAAAVAVFAVAAAAAAAAAADGLQRGFCNRYRKDVVK